MEFHREICILIEALESDTVTGRERMRIVEILSKNTTDNACMVKARENEPIFVLRAKDPIGSDTVTNWTHLAHAAGIHPDKMDDARKVALEMEEWHMRWLEAEQARLHRLRLRERSSNR